ncbi:hypothetical protein O181_036402 [Austropuccinia psidii MF-1]|uniref:Integrase catalytic domain-containing protein n=1 Tax=Austropuccinia psidii MF-1 TaxID=1389203 RepID=A0A9Q3D717_9BASI|nr:hypothetical protein [Austropuccinia psidii MF-1]
MENARELSSLFFTTLPTKLGIGFYPSLPYSPQENGEAECLNHTLANLASGMEPHFWQFTYASVCYMHNRLHNFQFPNSLPHQVLYGFPTLIMAMYPFGAEAVIHVLTVQQQHNPDARGIEWWLLKPLLASGGWPL